MAKDSRFNKYRSDGDFPPLWKPFEGASRDGRFVSDREYHAKNEDGTTRTVPVLNLADLETGEEWSFMSGAWRWLDELAIADPQPGDVVRISRHRDIGKARDLRLEVLERAEDIVAASTGKGGDDGDIPF